MVFICQTVDSANLSTNFTLNSTAEFNDSSIRFIGSSELPNTVEVFCNTPHPTSNQFDALEEQDKLQAFRNYLKVSSIPNRRNAHLSIPSFKWILNVFVHFITENTRKRLPCTFSFRYHQVVGDFIGKSECITYRYRTVQRLFWLCTKNEPGTLIMYMHWEK